MKAFGTMILPAAAPLLAQDLAERARQRERGGDARA